MAKSEDDHVIVAFFENESAARAATHALKKWDKANQDIKLGAIGRISREGDQVKTQVGRKTGQGAKVGAVIGIAAAVLSGGASLVGGALSGGVLGGVAGAFFKRSVNLSKDDIEQMGTELENGRVALVMACDEAELEATRTELSGLGGRVQNYLVPAQVLDEAAQALEETEANNESG
jgi:uncharacterized membrane protein